MATVVGLPELQDMVRQLGLEGLGTIQEHELVPDFMHAAVIGFADGDIVAMHQPYTGQQAELYGENHYGDGKVAQVLGRAAIENGMTPGILYDFQDLAAEYYTDPNSPFRAHQPQSSVRIYPEAVTIDDNPLALSRRPLGVLDYNACLTRRSYLSDQLRFLGQGLRPFSYLPLMRMHFTNRALMRTYNTDLGEGAAQQFIQKQLYIGREDGVAAATDEIIRAQSAHNAPIEIADVILSTGAQHTTPEDLKRGITNAHTLLKEGGMLVVRSLARPAADELGTDEIVGWALDAGFEEKKAIHYEASLNQIGTLILTSHFGEREIQTVVLTK